MNKFDEFEKITIAFILGALLSGFIIINVYEKKINTHIVECNKVVDYLKGD